MKPDKSTWKYKPLPVILRYWIFQGMVYMNWVERIHRLLFEGLIFALIFCLFPTMQSIILKFICIAVISHSLCVFINGHVIALCVHDLFWFSFFRDKTRFYRYMEEMRARIARKNPACLNGAFFWGSITRGGFKPTSDLDIRFVPEPGLWNGFRVANLVFVERWHALCAGFPLDAYMFRTWEETTRKMDVENEPAVSLWAKKEPCKFGNQKVETFDTFSSKFISE